MRQLIIDGYNVVMQGEPYRSLARADEWERARDALVADVASYAKGQFEATIVFDGARNDEEERKEDEQLGVHIHFSPYGATADAVIERLVRRARARGDAVEVVSSDALVQWTSLGEGVIRRSAAEFVEHLGFGYSEWERERDAPPRRSVLADRVSEEATELLRKIRDGEDS